MLYDDCCKVQYCFISLWQERSLLPAGSNQVERQVLPVLYHCLLPRQSPGGDPDHHRPILSMPSSGWHPHSGGLNACDVTARLMSVPARFDLNIQLQLLFNIHEMLNQHNEKSSLEVFACCLTCCKCNSIYSFICFSTYMPTLYMSRSLLTTSGLVVVSHA